MIIRDDIIQGSEEWLKEKAGIPGASSFGEIVTTKGEPSKQQQKYLYQLAGESLTGIKIDSYQNAAMQRGVELETEARELFKMINGVEVKQVGLCYRDEQKKYLCSPDGLMADEGLEIKCPLIHTHVEYLLTGKLPTKYIQQVQGSMMITGFKAWHFLSYFPGLPPLMLRIERDKDFIAKLETELDKFTVELALTVKKLKELQ